MTAPRKSAAAGGLSDAEFDTEPDINALVIVTGAFFVLRQALRITQSIALSRASLLSSV